MGAFHIPEAEAARDLSALMMRVYAGEEIVIDNGTAARPACGVPTDRSWSVGRGAG